MNETVRLAADRAADGAKRARTHVARLCGWRAWAAALVAGSASILAMAPFFAAWVLFATLPVLVWLLDGTASSPRRVAIRRALAVGWWFGFGYHAAGLFWIGEAFLVEAEIFAWLLPFAVTLMPAGLALFFAAATGLAARLWTSGWRRVLLLAVTVSAAEWLRGHVLTGFPWNLFGYALTEPLVLLQSASILGIYGLTLLVLIVAMLPAVMLADGGGPRREMIGALVAIGLLAGLVAFGATRLAVSQVRTAENVRIRIVQPSVPQREKWRPERQREFFQRHLDLSATAPDGVIDGLAGVTHVVWPEAAMPFQPLRSPEALAAIADRLGDSRWLIAGALRADVDPTGRRRAYNSLITFGREGAAAIYDKIHLVPFGEYLPFQPLLESVGLQQLTRMRGGFSVGETPRPLIEVPGLPPIGPLICYEAIFPSEVVQSQRRPGLLINVTNDGWFGLTTGPRQHFQQARVRAVEEGIPLLRAANNGISAMVDPYGRVLAKLELDVVGTIDVDLPTPLTLTLTGLAGEIVFAILWTCIVLTLIICRPIKFATCSDKSG